MSAGANAARQRGSGREPLPREARFPEPYRTTSTFLISSMPGPTILMKYRPRATLAPLLFVPSHVMP